MRTDRGRAQRAAKGRRPVWSSAWPLGLAALAAAVWARYRLAEPALERRTRERLAPKRGLVAGGAG